jgi:hypothetical protein
MAETPMTVARLLSELTVFVTKNPAAAEFPVFMETHCCAMAVVDTDVTEWSPLGSPRGDQDVVMIYGGES